MATRFIISRLFIINENAMKSSHSYKMLVTEDKRRTKHERISSGNHINVQTCMERIRFRINRIIFNQTKIHPNEIATHIHTVGDL